MTRSKSGIATLVLLCFTACERDPIVSMNDARTDASKPALTAATLGEQSRLPVSEYRALPEYSNADIEYGERVSMQCRACHTFEEGGPHMIGPNLYGFFGRRAGAVNGFPYSRALSGAEFMWTPRAFDAWLAAPTDFLPGNSMAYPGLPNVDDRRALIASLLLQTGHAEE